MDSKEIVFKSPGRMYQTRKFVYLILIHTVLADPYASMTRHKYACYGPDHCHSNLYSIECSSEEKIAMHGVSYGAKPYTSYCPKTEACLNKNLCCRHEPGDCLVPMNDSELVKIYRECSHTTQCGWLFASSTELEASCRIRDRSNYIKADYHCIHDRSFIDICSQHTVTAKSVHIHHSAIPPSIYNYNQCSCLISPDVCNTTAKLKFRAVDVRLQDKDNLTKCSLDSRIELIGQWDKKMYNCESGKFLHGFQDFHDSSENNMVMFLHKSARVYPTKVWLEVKASLSDVNVRVTCGPRSVETAPRCPAIPISQSETIDKVEDVPERKNNKPTIIHLDPDAIDPDIRHPEDEGPREKQNPAMAAIIGGIVAGVVVLILLLVLVCLIIRKKRVPYIYKL